MRRALGLGGLLVVMGMSGACATSGGPTPAAGEAVVAEDAAPRRVVLGPKVSKSRGEQGGVVLLWPRIIPSAQAGDLREQAAGLQARLEGLIHKAFPGRAVDVRPEPERVCPRSGCVAASVGVLILTVDGGCAAVVQVSPPGQSPAEQMVWAGVMSSSLEVPFREPPESYAKIRDFVPCGRLLETTRGREASVLDAIRAAR